MSPAARQQVEQTAHRGEALPLEVPPIMGVPSCHVTAFGSVSHATGLGLTVCLPPLSAASESVPLDPWHRQLQQQVEQ